MLYFSIVNKIFKKNKNVLALIYNVIMLLTLFGRLKSVYQGQVIISRYNNSNFYYNVL